MADSLTVKTTKTRKGQIRKEIGSYWHGPLLHLVEFGTAPHDIQVPIKRKGGGSTFGKRGGLVQAFKTIKHPGSPARPFLRPAIDEGGDLAVSAFAEEMAKGIARELNRQRWNVRHAENQAALKRWGL